MPEVKVGSIYKRFGGNYLNKDSINIERTVSFPGFTRLGFELHGTFPNDSIKIAVCWGLQESDFLNNLESDKLTDTLKNIFSKDPPLFILSKRFNLVDTLVELNKELNDNRSAIIHTDLNTSEIYALIGSWLSRALAKWERKHGTVLNIWGEGVLIIGEPGVGKSETASELIRLNHLFLGDDSIELARLGNIILAKANHITKDFIHLRGLGILNIKEMYGGAKIINETQISIVIELRHLDIRDPNRFNFENLGDTVKYYDLLGVSVPLYTLPVTSGRNMSDLVELSVIDMKLKKQGYNSAKELDKKLKKFLKVEPY